MRSRKGAEAWPRRAAGRGRRFPGPGPARRIEIPGGAASSPPVPVANSQEPVMAVSPTPVSTAPSTPFPVFDSSVTYQMACSQLEEVAAVIDIDRGVLERLSLPKRAMVVSIPVRMDDGRTEAF